MVRPERFELPTYWFVASRSIQLSYGRMKCKNHRQNIKVPVSVQLRYSGCRRLLSDPACTGIKGSSASISRPAWRTSFVTARGVEPSGVVLHAQRAGGVVEREPANAVDLAGVSQRTDHRLRRRVV